MTASERDSRLGGEAEQYLHKPDARPVVYTRGATFQEGRDPSMCGIAGFSLGSGSTVERTLAAQALLAGIAERGADAVGYAHRAPETPIRITKLRGGASVLLDELALPSTASAALLHVRDFTKGHPEIVANNHPIRHGAVVGVHNGVIENDDAVLARHGLDRAEPDMTVDSEAIFALMEHRLHDPRALSELRGTMAAAWMDERESSTLYLARGNARPLWIGQSDSSLLFASTRRALTIAEAILGEQLTLREVPEGRYLRVRAGHVVHESRFRPAPADRANAAHSPVRAPGEAVTCLTRLAALAAALG